MSAPPFQKNEESRLVEMKIKGSPKDSVWYGQRSLPNGPGFLCLNSLPIGCPLNKKSNRATLSTKALKSLNGDKVRAYCEDVERAPMHANLMQFASTLVVPTLGP